MTDWPGDGGRGHRALVIGAGLTTLWLVMLLILWLTGNGAGSGAPRWISVVAALMPLGLIWMAVSIARAIGRLRAEADGLRAELERDRDRERGSDPAPRGAVAAPPAFAPAPPWARRARPSIPRAPCRRRAGPPPPPPIPTRARRRWVSMRRNRWICRAKP